MPPNAAAAERLLTPHGLHLLPALPMNVLAEIRLRFRHALSGLVDDPRQLDELLEMVRASTDPKFGDYQANCAMPLGKRLGRAPRDVAAEIVAHLAIDDICQPPQVAGPGFINLTLRDEWILGRLSTALADDARLGIAPVADPRTVVVDYSSPNVAKPMHVGHIRSTVIGDALYRLLKFAGHRVISDNHIGDWGTQFGMILYGWKHFRDEAAYRADPVRELSRLYRLVHDLLEYKKLANERKVLLGDWEPLAAEGKRMQPPYIPPRPPRLDEIEQKMTELRGDCDFDSLEDPALAVLIHTAFLHSRGRGTASEGEESEYELWQKFMPHCMQEIEHIYNRLGVQFDHTLGESWYHDELPTLVDELLQLKLAIKSDGAICIFLEGFDTPMIVQKTGYEGERGGYLYATTDLATIRYRMMQWQPDAILYVVDHRQSLHFNQLFTAARRWFTLIGPPDWSDVELTHVSFGTVLGEDGRPFRTRSGETVGLGGLLDEAERRAYQIVSENDNAKPQPELSESERRRVATIVGIAAIKYADLSHNRTSDYVFSYDKMLATRGNTATYMQYAYARVRSIFRTGRVDIDALRRAAAEAAGERRSAIRFTHPAERALALGLLGLGEAIDWTLTDYRPNLLTAYLFDLATRYSTFYQECDVLKAEPVEVRTSRLLLCDLTARTLKLGLALLGIEVVEQM